MVARRRRVLARRAEGLGLASPVAGEGRAADGPKLALLLTARRAVSSATPRAGSADRHPRDTTPWYPAVDRHRCLRGGRACFLVMFDGGRGACGFGRRRPGLLSGLRLAERYTGRSSSCRGAHSSATSSRATRSSTRLALREARIAKSTTTRPSGAVIVHEGEVLAAAPKDAAARAPNPTAHARRLSLGDAGLGRLAGLAAAPSSTVLYVTLGVVRHAGAGAIKKMCRAN